MKLGLVIAGIGAASFVLPEIIGGEHDNGPIVGIAAPMPTLTVCIPQDVEGQYALLPVLGFGAPIWGEDVVESDLAEIDIDFKRVSLNREMRDFEEDVFLWVSDLSDIPPVVGFVLETREELEDLHKRYRAQTLPASVTLDSQMIYSVQVAIDLAPIRRSGGGVLKPDYVVYEIEGREYRFAVTNQLLVEGEGEGEGEGEKCA